jgi:hypothetical protein
VATNSRTSRRRSGDAQSDRTYPSRRARCSLSVRSAHFASRGPWAGASPASTQPIGGHSGSKRSALLAGNARAAERLIRGSRDSRIGRAAAVTPHCHFARNQLSVRPSRCGELPGHAPGSKAAASSGSASDALALLLVLCTSELAVTRFARVHMQTPKSATCWPVIMTVSLAQAKHLPQSTSSQTIANGRGCSQSP